MLLQFLFSDLFFLRPLRQNLYRSLLGFGVFSILMACVPYGYQGEVVEPEKLPPYKLEIKVLEEPHYDHDGYEVSLLFRLHSQEPFPYRYLIQEIEQTLHFYDYNNKKREQTFSLVEVFRMSGVPERKSGLWIYNLEPFQHDRHFETGFTEYQGVFKRVLLSRKIRIYPAMVAGADFTFLGFAHLPENRDGSLQTHIPHNFNRSYQKNHETRGKVLVDDRERGSRFYELDYQWYDEKHDFKLETSPTSFELSLLKTKPLR